MAICKTSTIYNQKYTYVYKCSVRILDPCTAEAAQLTYALGQGENDVVRWFG